MEEFLVSCDNQLSKDTFQAQLHIVALCISIFGIFSLAHMHMLCKQSELKQSIGILCSIASFPPLFTTTDTNIASALLFILLHMLKGLYLFHYSYFLSCSNC